MTEHDRGLVDARTALRAAVEPTPTTIGDVIEQLAKIEQVACQLEPRGKDDGIGCFTRLYKEVTEAVLQGYEDGRFRAGDFIRHLDVAFAQRYLDALRADLAHDESERGRTPTCWRLLFDGRREKVAVWRFAVVGVNAHVNFDLAFALVNTWRDHPPGASVDDQHADYDAINDIFAEKMDRFRRDYHAPGGGAEVDGHIPDRLWNLASDLLVEQTRELAWDEAMGMWENPASWERRTDRLDTIASFVARRFV